VVACIEQFRQAPFVMGAMTLFVVLVFVGRRWLLGKL